MSHYGLLILRAAADILVTAELLLAQIRLYLEFLLDKDQEKPLDADLKASLKCEFDARNAENIVASRQARRGLGGKVSETPKRSQ